MKCDICIIGSGAGGSPIAYELANQGYSVIVLEKGEYYKEEDFNKERCCLSLKLVIQVGLSSTLKYSRANSFIFRVVVGRR